MTAVSVAAFMVGAAVMSVLLSKSVIRFRIARLLHANVRGVLVSAVLGIILFAATLSILLGAAVALALAGRWSAGGTRILLVLAGAALVFGAGLIDDMSGSGPRGLREHLTSLGRGRATTGLLKIGASIAGGILVALALPGREFAEAVLVGVTVAGCCNVWNGLDVVPGRAGKVFVLSAIIVLLTGSRSAPWAVLAVMLGAEVPLLFPDLRERAMLGDAGANLLGFAIGAAVATSHSTPGLLVAVAVVVLLNLLAETVSFSRLVRSVAPLRWFDGLGRVSGPSFPPN